MIIEGIHVFPLNKVLSYLNDYYIDAAGKVYSTKKGPLTELMGSQQWPAKTRTYTLAKQTFTSEFLLKRAQGHKDFVADTAPQKLTLKDAPTATQFSGLRSHAVSVEEAITKRGTIIAKVEGGKLVFSSNPTAHTTDESWKNEIQRLATSNPGVQYVGLQIVGAVTAGGINWA